MANATFPFPENLWIMIPEMIIAVMAMTLLLVDLFVAKDKKYLIAYATIASCVLAIVALLNIQSADGLMTFYGYFVYDPFAVFAKILILVATVFTVILSLDFMKDEENVGEYYCLILFAVLGMMLMASSNNFITFYLGLELMALSIYVLVAYQRDVLRSTEAALKYFILGSLSSGMLLYGVTFLYGVTTSFDFNAIGQALASTNASAHIAVMLGMLFVIAGMAFKVSVAPFHMWTPDTYEGAPTPVTAFMSVAPKVAGFVVFMRVLVDAMPAIQHDYTQVLIVLAGLTIIVGNVAAIAQRNIKRMLAYSTVGHVGFVLLGLIAANQEGYTGALMYLTIYLFMNMGVFAIIILMRRDGIQGELIDDFAGLSRVRPGYALAMGLLLFSLAGIPFLAGFWAKLLVIAAVIKAGHLYLGVLAIVFSVVGSFYYLRLIKYMYFDEERVTFNFIENNGMRFSVVVCALAVVVLGLYPDPVIAICKNALVGLI
ncbi:MAG: NADH-quinone oxidoreductase subunit NuoN [Zetaproteobacteria bacterium CG_4_9_14_3_um_filter_49_83]|nr:MAG: NADH:ubiquinone oxidoreductase subunit 2 [Zetaproteobacteria bacterium CG1_02_49_23]PIQ30481.1 MAG: NADH-quinone oxidoreductase subunit NuoN [Zetaproteobacteria bacterium CG17_big_fil_post_rev_8_21_14_2_50_50_13]PIV31596.1 MAG: NADH-quinone oxidoreductase subunit NuoN [Zetaproteobacteria bacterium CG02_land_8_20_14_3_00_50_9]PIY55263.1 MAG: NADH-quinone oxidoreductase subunit NuoN [Zetaproteobacteria bacterium CG_4_10_14_0_8_um_filter_49_80]PJA36075.1 MAG: NADH-quinone oxidoreductase su